VVTPKRASRLIQRPAWDKWLRLSQIPLSETVIRSLIDRGEIISALVKTPGTNRGVRLIEAASLEAYLHHLAAEQRRAGESQSDHAPTSSGQRARPISPIR
jgi:hypothetical protein